MKCVRSRWLFATLFVIAGGSAFGEVGLGLTASDDFPDVPEAKEIYSRLIASGEITPGILAFFKERDWGMSFDFGFDITTDVPESTTGDPS